MRKSPKLRAEQLFSASQKKTDQFLKQKEKAWQESLDKTARLKALRLAKEAADKESAAAADLRQRFDRLTDKEREVVDLVVQGRTNKEIASQRGVSSQAIDATRKRAMDKLGVETIAEMVQLAMKLGMKPGDAE